TWFDIRVNKDGWSCRRKRLDVMVCMNPESIDDDIADCSPGTVLLIRDTLVGHVKRNDLVVYSVPFDKLVLECCPEIKLRKMVVNIIYVGILAHLLDIEMSEIEKAIVNQFGGKEKAIKLNADAAKYGFAWAQKNITKKHKIGLKRLNKTAGKIIMDGNAATALGLMFGGITVVAWYPITPSSSVAESLIGFLDEYRRDADGKATFAVLQAEDELASIGMVLGASWAGARAATCTSGPGVSLMAEFAGLSYFAEIPAVIVDVQRMGPSTGLPTRIAQGDIQAAYYLSHGDTRHIMLFPGNLKECFEFGAEVLNLSERFQTLVFLMTDLDIGMNNWASEPFQPLTKPISRGKVLDAQMLEKLGKFERYGDAEGDGIPFRTLPGTDHPLAPFFTRGSGHNAQAKYTEKPHDWKANIDRLRKKLETARKELPAPVVETQPGATVGLIAYGSSDPAVQEARHLLKTQHGIATDYLRIRALPPSTSILDFINKHKSVYLIEQNRDGQMAGILRDEFPTIGDRVHSILHYDGSAIEPEGLAAGVVAGEKK
ncbi:MAG TPA: 2-oxoacid:acceptor oxidoreductase subunit alpha, partial [Planctomycetota bacterium]|nr:2-oxoacid:acceptor oxidoreductase subunit alpha [Planctomycetota bacterium]